MHRPVPNRERCQGCHGSDHQVRAVVRIATSMAPLFAEVARQRNWQILIGLLTIAAAGGVLAVAMHQVVVRPIQQLAQVARRIGAGDLEARATLRATDEVGELGRALNTMTARLAQARHDLAARNTELAAALENLQASRRQVQLLEQLKGELSKFVPDAVKRLLERDPNATELQKRLEEVSVLFLDITGYARLSEQLDHVTNVAARLAGISSGGGHRDRTGNRRANPPRVCPRGPGRAGLEECLGAGAGLPARPARDIQEGRPRLALVR